MISIEIDGLPLLPNAESPSPHYLREMRKFEAGLTFYVPIDSVVRIDACLLNDVDVSARNPFKNGWERKTPTAQ